LLRQRPVRHVLFSLLLILGPAVAAQQPRKVPFSDFRPTVILISIDGFRYDYLEKYKPPNLVGLAATGVRADALLPCFPTYTFPNHYSIVTGLYPAHHGIVANEMYDPQSDATFVYNQPSALESRWWGGEPIWVTADKQGQKSASMFWPGSATEIEGMRPDYWAPFDARISPQQRVDKILHWLDLPREQRPRFLALYFEQVDHEGHERGPDSAKVGKAIAQVDAAIGSLIDGVRQRGIADRVNIIVVSDHGMAAASRQRVVFIDDYVDLSHARVLTTGPLFSIWPAAGKADSLIAQLRRVPHLRVYRREDAPARWHYSGNPRIAPILALADEGWTITDHAYFKSHDFHYGQHGYDNNLRSMQGVFIAHGPALKPGTRLPAFSNVDVYELLAYLLHLTPAKNDGTLEVFRPALASQTVSETQRAQPAAR
jgi:predicted AlkP superfamily pyrophosphatase or phosphodiesterase